MAHFSAATITVFALTLDKEITVGAPLLASPPRRTFTSSPAVVTGVNYYSARRRAAICFLSYWSRCAGATSSSLDMWLCLSIFISTLNLKSTCATLH